ncbi:unnamed protein product [Schistosoma rodhaini]|uniref:Uncharacterized protein n=1 Tax=Schistosoma rodhaini TaxID=6188 RepID=A0AA85FWI6_9TREM|nr:unnamed protein product [Schistosoma rodhaini]
MNQYLNITAFHLCLNNHLVTKLPYIHLHIYNKYMNLKMQILSMTMFTFIIVCVLITKNLFINGQLAEYYMNDEIPEVNNYDNIYPRFIHHHHRSQYKRGGMYGGLLGK